MNGEWQANWDKYYFLVLVDSRHRRTSMYEPHVDRFEWDEWKTIDGDTVICRQMANVNQFNYNLVI